MHAQPPTASASTNPAGTAPAAQASDTSPIPSTAANTAVPAERTLTIHGVTVVSTMVLPSLFFMGFNAVHVRDSRIVPPSSGVPPEWVGRPREAMACHVVQQWCPQVRIEKLRKPTLTLMVGELTVDPVEEQLLMEDRQPFLTVMTVDDGIDIGPWVSSPHHPCSTCQMLHYQDRDPSWIRSMIERQSGFDVANASRAILETVSLLTRILATFDSEDPLLPHGHVFHVQNDGQAFDEEITVHPRCPWHRG